MSTTYTNVQQLTHNIVLVCLSMSLYVQECPLPNKVHIKHSPGGSKKWCHFGRLKHQGILTRTLDISWVKLWKVCLFGTNWPAWNALSEKSWTTCKDDVLTHHEITNHVRLSPSVPLDFLGKLWPQTSPKILGPRPPRPNPTRTACASGYHQDGNWFGVLLDITR